MKRYIACVSIDGQERIVKSFWATSIQEAYAVDVFTDSEWSMIEQAFTDKATIQVHLAADQSRNGS